MNREVLLIGNITLREQSKPVTGFSDDILRQEITDLKDTLDTFRKVNGFGRAIAAVQIGILKRLIALNLGKETFVIINPKITSTSDEKFTLWDDCMSFPDLFVRVERYKTISIEYQDEEGNKKIWEHIGQAESELLQHEIDHLDGILAVDRIIEKEDIIYKSEFNKQRSYYENKVDYKINPIPAQ